MTMERYPFKSSASNACVGEEKCHKIILTLNYLIFLLLLDMYLIAVIYKIKRHIESTYYKWIPNFVSISVW